MTAESISTCNKCGAPMTLQTMATKRMCKKCANAKAALYRMNNREKVREYNRHWMQARRWLDGADNEPVRVWCSTRP